MHANKEVQRRQENAVQQELRRLVSNRQPPSAVAASAFGPWADVITDLRVCYVRNGPDACQTLFLEKDREHPLLGVLLSRDPQPEGRKISWTWADLQKAGFPDPVWVVPGVIPCGLVTIGGRPKIGKSWLALQIACAVGTGGRVFDRPVGKGKVLYLALEDSPRRLKMRGLKQLWPADADVTFDIEWPTLGKGGTAALRKRIEVDGYTLVIVDTLTRALGGLDQMDLAETALAVGELQRLAQDLNVTVLLLDHLRKSNGLSPDPVDDLLGSTGKAQPLDGVCGLYRERGKKEATLKVTGRDVEDVDLSLVFDGLTCTWTPAREPGGVKKDGPQAAVLAAIGDITAAGELAYASRVAELLGKDPSNVGRAVAELVRQGVIREGTRQGNIVPLRLATPPGEERPDLPQQAQGPQGPQAPLPGWPEGERACPPSPGPGTAAAAVPAEPGEGGHADVPQEAQGPQEPQAPLPGRPEGERACPPPPRPTGRQRPAAAGVAVAPEPPEGRHGDV